MRHVFWIGGPPASGKTTVATRLARRHGLRWYGADTRTWEHRERAVQAGNPAAIPWEATRSEERWTLPAADLLELSLHRERGPTDPASTTAASGRHWTVRSASRT